MGWWSTSVMGGDGPYDIQAEFEERFLVCVDRDEYKYELQEAIDPQDVIHFIDNCTLDDICVVGQVAGFLQMTYGQRMNKELRANLIEYAKEDEWAYDNDERKAAMDRFIHAVNVYPSEGGEADLPEQHGLLYQLLDAIDKGNEGLINK